MAGSSVSRASLRAAGMPRVRQVSAGTSQRSLGGMDAAPYSGYQRRPAPPAEGTSGGKPERIRTVRRLYGKWTGRIRAVSGSGKEAAGIPLLTAPSQGYFRMRGVFRVLFGCRVRVHRVFPYARSVPFREHPPGQTRRALYEDMAYYRLFVRSWKGTR